MIMNDADNNNGGDDDFGGHGNNDDCFYTEQGEMVLMILHGFYLLCDKKILMMR